MTAALAHLGALLSRAWVWATVFEHDVMLLTGLAIVAVAIAEIEYKRIYPNDQNDH